ncbi:MAG: prepilin-type N-terminal cleavage/methylation domain-containing protein [Terriglobia bacterium]
MFQLLRPKNADVEAGFTMIELMLSLAIVVLVFGMAFEAFQKALPSMRADSSMQLLEAQLRQAREVAIDQRRYVTVTFQGTSELVAVIVGLNGSSNTQLYDYVLPERMAYTLFAGIGDTPDGYGDTSAVTYNCPGSTLPCTITFNSDGSVQDGQSGSSNGSIFIGIAGQTQTARAVTILSATGKIKGWRYTGSAWK